MTVEPRRNYQMILAILRQMHPCGIGPSMLDHIQEQLAHGFKQEHLHVFKQYGGINLNRKVNAQSVLA